MSKSVYKEHELSRRRFLGNSACAAMGFTGVVNTLAHLRMMNAAMAAGGPIGDYKAFVVLFLFGGNDSFNMLVPATGHPERQNYEDGRGILTLGDNGQPGDILPLTTTGDPYGVHPLMPGVQAMFNNGDLGFLANVGSLAEPIADRAEYLGGGKVLPVQLFSHSNLQEQWQSSIPDKPFTSGWGGRMADILNSSYGNGDVSMNITLAGVNSFQVGTGGVVQYGVSTTGAKSLNGYFSSTDPDTGNYNNAFEADGVTYENNDPGRRLKAFESIMDYTLAQTGENLHEVGFDSVVKRARINEAFIGDAIAVAEGGAVDIDQIFTDAGATSGTANQLKMVVKLIAGRDCLGNQRQVFFASQGGFDNHRDMLPSHSTLMDDLDKSLTAFNNAIKALGIDDKVVLVTHSDFARTLTPNGNDANTSGSDHAWGGNAIMLGGPVNGGKVYGHFPSLVTGADMDAGSSRGRWIPTTSVDQFSAVCAKWFGITDPADLAAVFPNLDRFADPFTDTSTNLDFLNLGA